MPPKPPLNGALLPPSFLIPISTRSTLSSLALASHISRTTPYTCKRSNATMKFKSTQDLRASRFNYENKTTPLQATSTAALDRKAHSTPLRTGVLALKRGMTALFDVESGKRMACTVLQMDRNEVVAHKTRDKNGYWAVQVGAGQKLGKNTTRPMLGHFATARGMKRHGFSGQPASHGQSLMHRGMGSAGGSQGSGSRVLPGKRMPGRMGGENVTVKNLRVMQVDEKNGIVVVKGCVPGPKNQILRIHDALGKPWPSGPMTLADITPAKTTTIDLSATAESTTETAATT
ncbi:translation protein [Amniculicola lignicola CBS 123094]|uniref:Large ribosomal subunit protein uL3m n=1 Tax=Amniculicola lignicola CBS 123094 TaxID=1392246 RepID=A0A6A5WPG2_9PLEO|nr:translation protein [Amniculicola lignicola CBS 123094]